MGIVAGFLVQNTLKHLLEFGEVTNYLGYTALTDFFPTMNLKPNPQCEDANCRLRQKEAAVRPKKVQKEEIKDEGPLHEDNEWGISLVDESIPDTKQVEVTKGVTLAYTLPSDKTEASNEVNANSEISLDDLMAQMKNI